MLSDVTVVIPAYNSSQFIEETLRSVVQQTTPPSEIVVVDDCSTDETVERVRTLAQCLSVPCRLIVQASGSGGPAVPMNVGIEAAQTEWIALLDHDDRMCPTKLNRQQQAVTETGADIAFSDFTMFDGDSRLPGVGVSRNAIFDRCERSPSGFRVLSPETFLQEQIIDPGLVMSCSNLFFRKSLWEKWGPFDAQRSVIADHLFKLKLAASTSAAFVPEVLFEKRVHRENLFDTSDGIELRKELFRIAFGTIRRHPELTIADGVFRQRFYSESMARAYWWRKSGFLIDSLWLYAKVIAELGVSVEMVEQLVKWPVGAVRDTIARRVGKDESKRIVRL